MYMSTHTNTHICARGGMRDCSLFAKRRDTHAHTSRSVPIYYVSNGLFLYIFFFLCTRTRVYSLLCFVIKYTTAGSEFVIVYINIYLKRESSRLSTYTRQGARNYILLVYIFKQISTLGMSTNKRRFPYTIFKQKIQFTVKYYFVIYIYIDYAV